MVSKVFSVCSLDPSVPNTGASGNGNYPWHWEYHEICINMLGNMYIYMYTYRYYIYIFICLSLGELRWIEQQNIACVFLAVRHGKWSIEFCSSMFHDDLPRFLVIFPDFKLSKAFNDDFDLFYFSIYREESSQLTHIFQRGWNHQPASHEHRRSLWLYSQAERLQSLPKRVSSFSLRLDLGCLNMGDGDPKIEGFHGKDDDQMNSKGELLFRQIRSGNFTQPNVQRCGEVQVDVPGSFWECHPPDLGEKEFIYDSVAFSRNKYMRTFVFTELELSDFQDHVN